MKFLSQYESPNFPNPQTAENNGILAIGGKLNTEWILSAYKKGIFPWFSKGDPIIWWAPNPRAVMKPSEIKIQKSMHSYLNNNKFELKIDSQFRDVMIACAQPRKNQKDTWITSEIIDVYSELHHLGYAHSFEAWKNDKLVGGLYGMSLGKIFFGESMFSVENNASKFTFIRLCQILEKNNFNLIDCQIESEHLSSLGCQSIDRKDFILLLKKNAQYQTIKNSWSNFI